MAVALAMAEPAAAPAEDLAVRNYAGGGPGRSALMDFSRYVSKTFGS